MAYHLNYIGFTISIKVVRCTAIWQINGLILNIS
jgi:hypothetical protein